MCKWNSPHNAALYDAYTRHHNLYRDTSRDLIQLVRLKDASLVVDLACGTGVTTEVMLCHVKESAKIISLDKSEEMLKIAQERISDPRVTWVNAAAIELPHYAAEADAIVCNAAIWQLEMAAAIDAAAKTLRAGGRFAFNISRQLLMMPLSGEELRPTKPRFSQIVQAVAILEHDFVPHHRALSRRRLTTSKRVERMLTRVGLTLDEIQPFEYDNPPAAQLDWLKVPVFAQNVLPDMPYEEQLKAITTAYGRYDKSSIKSQWFAFLACKT